MERIWLPAGSWLMSKEDEEREMASTGSWWHVDKETFKKLRADFDIKKLMSEFLIKKENFVFKWENDVKKDYTFMKELGKGTYGNVYLAKHKVTGWEWAIKEIQRTKIKWYERFINEVTAMKTLDHPNIIKLFEIYESEEAVYLVQELCTGGELFEWIVQDKYMSEHQAAIIFE